MHEPDNIPLVKNTRKTTHGSKDSLNVAQYSSLSTVRMDRSHSQEDDQQSCGWLFCKPKCLQYFLTARWAVFFLGCGALLQGFTVNGLLHLIITTIENRFELSSRQSGLVSTSYDIASLVCLVPLSYLGGRPNATKPLWIGNGLLLMAVGSLVFALPQFLVKPTQPVQNNNLCNVSVATTQNSARIMVCEKKKQNPASQFMWLFVVGNLLHGAGAAPLFTLAITYVDAGVPKEKSSVYIGIFYIMAIIGPALGYVLGGHFLQIHTDFLTNDPQFPLTPDSKLWIGAWWIGFLLSSLLFFLIAIPVLGLPKTLPMTSGERKDQMSEVDMSTVRRTQPFVKFTELPDALIEMRHNLPFIFINLAGCCEGMIFSGMNTFMPKIIEKQFNMSSKSTAIVMGLITIPGALIGTVFGGWIIKHYKLRVAQILKWCMFSMALAMSCMAAFFITCPNEDFVGVNCDYANSISESEIHLFNECNMNCGCSTNDYSPVCGRDDKTYYSPCFAGCLEEKYDKHKGKMVYYKCSCIGESIKAKQLDKNNEADNDPCYKECKQFPLFITFMFLSLMFTFSACMPALAATLRCVRPDQRPLALGIQWLLVRMLGTIPGPLVFGALIDKACTLWHVMCDEEGACLLYDNFYLSRYVMSLGFIWKTLEIVCFGLSLLFYQPSKQTDSRRSTN